MRRAAISDRKRAASIANLAKAVEVNKARVSTAVAKNCPVCGEEFKSKRSHADKTTYCSTECMATAYKTRMAGKSNPNYRNAMGRVCQQCGDAFESYVKTRKFCSLACYHIVQAQQPNKFGRGGIDGNQGAIVQALRAVGAGVQTLTSLGRGVPDLMCCFDGRIVLVEVKNPKTTYGKKGFSPAQQKWVDAWGGPMPTIAYTAEDAFAALGIPTQRKLAL